MSFDESLVFLKTFGRHLETDVDYFFKIAMGYKITKHMCKDLEQFQRAGVSIHDVDFDHENNCWVQSNNATAVASNSSDHQIMMSSTNKEVLQQVDLNCKANLKPPKQLP